jgi:hypothetical protein
MYQFFEPENGDILMKCRFNFDGLQGIISQKMVF